MTVLFVFLAFLSARARFFSFYPPAPQTDAHVRIREAVSVFLVCLGLPGGPKLVQDFADSSAKKTSTLSHLEDKNGSSGNSALGISLLVGPSSFADSLTFFFFRRSKLVSTLLLPPRPGVPCCNRNCRPKSSVPHSF